MSRQKQSAAVRALGALSVGVLAIGLAAGTAGTAGAQTLNTEGITNIQP